MLVCEKLNSEDANAYALYLKSTLKTQIVIYV